MDVRWKTILFFVRVVDVALVVIGVDGYKLDNLQWGAGFGL